MKRAGGFIILSVMVLLMALVVKLLTKDYTIHCTKHSAYRPYDVKDSTVQNKFVIIIPSYNNEEYVEKNLGAVFEQKYPHYRVIYIDDCSIDATHAKVMDCIQKYHMEEKVTVIRNQKNQKALYNLYYAIHSCDDDEICILLDGDDWFASAHVLRDLNRYYNDEEVWMTFGQFITYPYYQRGKCRMPFLGALGRGKVRKKPFLTKDSDFLFSHLRTFYAGLFKRIKMRDLLYEGNFYPVAWDLAMMLPMLEMSREHAIFIPEIMYIYNRENPLSDDRLRLKQQKFLDQEIRSLPAYAPLQEHPKKKLPESDRMQADLLIFSKDRPMQLFSFLESFYQYATHFDQVYVSFRVSDFIFAQGYKIVQDHFPNVIFLQENVEGFEEILAKVLDPASKEYIVLTEDRTVLKDDIDLKESIGLLEQTGSYSFSFHLGLNISELPANIIPVGKGCFIWQFSFGRDEWGRSNNLHTALYRKKDVKHYMDYMTFTTSEEFRGKWKKGVEMSGLGLCYKDSRALEVPMRITKVDNGEKILLYTDKELNDKFLEGLKIDISPIFQMQNSEPTIEFYPMFVYRK